VNIHIITMQRVIYTTQDQESLLERVTEKSGLSRSSALREGLKLLAEKLGIEEANE